MSYFGHVVAFFLNMNRLPIIGLILKFINRRIIFQNLVCRNGFLDKAHGIKRMFNRRCILRRRALYCELTRKIQKLRDERDNLLAEKIRLEAEISNLAKSNPSVLVKKETI